MKQIIEQFYKKYNDLNEEIVNEIKNVMEQNKLKKIDITACIDDGGEYIDIIGVILLKDTISLIFSGSSDEGIREAIFYTPENNITVLNEVIDSIAEEGGK